MEEKKERTENREKQKHQKLRVFMKKHPFLAAVLCSL